MELTRQQQYEKALLAFQINLEQDDINKDVFSSFIFTYGVPEGPDCIKVRSLAWKVGFKKLELVFFLFLLCCTAFWLYFDYFTFFHSSYSATYLI
jgi:hypothetical protein